MGDDDAAKLETWMRASFAMSLDLEDCLKRLTEDPKHADADAISALMITAAAGMVFQSDPPFTQEQFETVVQELRMHYQVALRIHAEKASSKEG